MDTNLTVSKCYTSLLFPDTGVTQETGGFQCPMTSTDVGETHNGTQSEADTPNSPMILCHSPEPESQQDAEGQHAEETHESVMLCFLIQLGCRHVTPSGTDGRTLVCFHSTRKRRRRRKSRGSRPALPLPRKGAFQKQTVQISDLNVCKARRSTMSPPPPR